MSKSTYTMKCETGYLNFKNEPQPTCDAVICHGPGHQSTTQCYLTGDHEIHETRYGRLQQLARWKGGDVFSGFFDEPPPDPEEIDNDQ